VASQTLGHTWTDTIPHPRRHAHLPAIGGIHNPLFPCTFIPHVAMILKYMSLDLLNSSIADMGSGVQLFVVRTESFYTTERIYHPSAGTKGTCIRRRRTVITDIHQRQVAEIVWAGRVPLSISLKGETLDGVTPLFNGCESVTVVYVTCHLSRTVAHHLIYADSSPHRSSELKVPTRIGAVWVATRDSLEVLTASR
jgi:hypothetical protein